MSNSHYNYWFNSNLTTETLCGTLSDYSKDVHGSRLRIENPTRDLVCKHLALLDEYVENPNNREELRARHWYFDDDIKNLEKENA